MSERLSNFAEFVGGKTCAARLVAERFSERSREHVEAGRRSRDDRRLVLFELSSKQWVVFDGLSKRLEQ